MTIADLTSIRSLFSTRRPIDRPIEKVIDYYATDESRLRAEVEEYEVTDNVERNLRRFLDVFGSGVRTGQVTETGIWVSGFYGSGKSSFTKYLGFALDPGRTIGGRPFVDLLAERIASPDVRQELKTIAARHPVAVIMLDLGAEQLASSSVTTVSTVLYWKVLQSFGYSKEEKLAHLEFRLDREGRLDTFREAYRSRFGGSWEDVHDDPLLGVSGAAQIVPQFFPKEFPQPRDFSQLRFSLAGDVRDRAAEIVDLIRRKTGRQNVLFLIDEVGQYVAPRGELILNLDGLARNFKELGQGHVWIVATGQQTLTEIVERAAFNSAELNKLRDRFPIAIELDARDIREITWRRLLSKSADGEEKLRDLFRHHGQALTTHTRLTGTALFKGDVDEETFVRLYPFLPQHFDLLLDLVRVLARSTGGIGLRSAIRVIQDLLVDTSKVLPPGTPLLADAPVGHLATADQFFDTLRADVGKALPHVVAGVDRVARAFPNDDLALRVAKAIAALQPLDSFPRTPENVAAILYRQVGDPPHVDAVRETVRRLLDTREIGLVDDPQSGGLAFLSDAVKSLRDRRNAYVPTAAEVNQRRSAILQTMFDPVPSATLEGAKTVRAGVRFGRVPIVGEDEEVQFRVDVTDGSNRERRRQALLTETTGNVEWKAAIAWLVQPDESIDDLLVEIIRSRKIVHDLGETDADRDVGQFVRAERRSAESNEDRARTLFRQALLDGTFIFRGKPTATVVAGSSLDAATSKILQEAAAEIYPRFHLVNLRPATDLAARFLGVDRLDRMPRDLDPLGFVAVTSGRARVDPRHPALAEALRTFREKLDTSGTTRLQGNAVQDLFAAAPYGWSKDATRYVFAALLLAGEIVLHTASGEVRTAGPAAIEAVRSTQAFGRVGVAIRDSRPLPEALDRAATRLETLFGSSVLPLEDHISRAVREHLPPRLEQVTGLAEQLRLLGLAGADRAQSLLDTSHVLRQQDGAGAIAVLGATTCTFPDDLRWAEAVAQALENGADRDVHAARSALREADDLARLFPTDAATLVGPTDRDTVRDVLASETFYARLADLRGVERAIRDRAVETYRASLNRCAEELKAIQGRLEARTEWLLVSDDDRADIAARLDLGLPSTPDSGQELDALKLLLVRLASLPRLEAELVRELERRVPPPPPDEVVVDVATLLPTQPLTSTDDLDSWLMTVRSRIEPALADHRSVRLRVTR